MLFRSSGCVDDGAARAAAALDVAGRYVDDRDADAVVDVRIENETSKNDVRVTVQRARIPDDEAGEIPVAHVVARPGVELDPDEVMAFVAGHVAHYKQVRKVVITDAIPKSASGKILRRMLK